MMRQDLYNLGFIPSFFFGIRFIILWILSEKAGKLIVPRLFWVLSLFGNVTLAVHGCIQEQFLIASVQSINAVFSWRNLDLLRHKPLLSFWRTFFLAAAALVCISFVFFIYNEHTFASPTGSHHCLLHFLGTFGVLIFALRFWIQWYESECQSQSILSPRFFAISFIGGLLSVFYFCAINDPVNIVGYGLALIPAWRSYTLSLRGHA